MFFVSIEFVIFCAIVCGVFYSVKPDYRWIVLLAGSIIFYLSYGLSGFAYVLATAVSTYFAARIFSRCDSDNKKEVVLFICFIVVLGLLFYTKYLPRLIEALGAGDSVTFFFSRLIVPLGISYYTLSAIGYVLDVYWGHTECEKNFFYLLLYLIYFPHILQGPIPRYSHLREQLFGRHAFSYRRFTFGCQLMLWGYIQKTVIADRMGIFVSQVYGEWRNQNCVILLAATFFCAFQMYMDFSGCMDIARGFSQVLGIELESNFARPFFSTSVAEYWRRWHITLGNWFRDYLCMPIVMSKAVKDKSREIRKKKGKSAGRNYVTIVSLSAVWLCTGVWHGAGWNYVLWGIGQGMIIILSTVLEDWYTRLKRQLHISDDCILWKCFQIVRTFILAAMIPKAFTQLPYASEAFGFLKGMVHFGEVSDFSIDDLYNYGLDKANFWFCFIMIGVLFVISFLKERGISIREKVAGLNIAVRWLVYMAAIFLVIIFGIYGQEYDKRNFIYMQF